MLKKLRCWLFGHKWKMVYFVAYTTGPFYRKWWCQRCKETFETEKRISDEKTIDKLYDLSKPISGEDARQEK